MLQTHCKEMDNVLTIYPPSTLQLHSEFSWSILLQFPSSGNFQYILNVPNQCFFQENLQDIQNVPNQCSHSVLAQCIQSFLLVFQPMCLQCTQGGKCPVHCEYPKSCDQNVLSGDTMGKLRISQKKVPTVIYYKSWASLTGVGRRGPQETSSEGPGRS